MCVSVSVCMCVYSEADLIKVLDKQTAEGKQREMEWGVCVCVHLCVCVCVIL